MPLLIEFEVQRHALLSLCFTPKRPECFEKHLFLIKREYAREADHCLCPVLGPEMLAASTFIAHVQASKPLVREVFIDLLPFTTSSAQ